jgi:hypothetical protein
METGETDEMGPEIIYSIKGYHYDRLVFQIIVDRSIDGCFASDFALKRRSSLLNIAISVAEYITSSIYNSAGTIVRTVKYVPSLTGEIHLPIGFQVKD